MKAPRIAGYTYKADTYCPGCIVRQLSIIAERGFSDVRERREAKRERTLAYRAAIARKAYERGAK